MRRCRAITPARNGKLNKQQPRLGWRWHGDCCWPVSASIAMALRAGRSIGLLFSLTGPVRVSANMHRHCSAHLSAAGEDSSVTVLPSSNSGASASLARRRMRSLLCFRSLSGIAIEPTRRDRRPLAALGNGSGLTWVRRSRFKGSLNYGDVVTADQVFWRRDCSRGYSTLKSAYSAGI